ncbi:MAG: 30S ribosomal protein S20 [Clostridia bacterium]|nr:30S ribosomal protein S20 [Clostridia bacterium]MBQ2273357.1 30S ribosomal protein S20 [Clostridia bacterium]MBQ5820571.1 30S ribosomal protein S20 [Clostridia bacterium]
MPNIKSAKKRVLVNQSKNLENKMQKSAFRTQLKALEAEKSPENLQKAYSLVDKAAAKGLIHANCAARKKSRLAAEFAAE